jgi:hypothetical protein
MPSQVPEDGLKAAADATPGITTGQWTILRNGLQAFLDWQAANPVILSASLRHDLWLIANRSANLDYACMDRFLAEFVRRQYAAPVFQKKSSGVGRNSITNLESGQRRIR